MTKTPKWQPDGSGIDPESLDVGTVVEWDGQVSRPPSQAVIEAVEQAEREHRWFEWCGNHPDGEFCCECGTHDTSPHHRRFEVARAAEAAALGAIAGDWLIERTYGLSDEGIKGWPEINANAYRCAIEDAQSALRERANELTDTDDRSK